MRTGLALILWGGVMFALGSGDSALAEPVAEVSPVRVMSFNIRYSAANDGENAWPKRRDFLVETITAFNPDLLGTQEVLPDQRDYLVQKLPGYEVLAAGREDGKEKGEMVAVFYRKDRFEKRDGGHFWLSPTPEKVGEKGWDAALPRMVTWVKLVDKTDAKAKPILFVNTHFDHRGVKARLESARLVREKIGSLGEGCRVIVTGDFNSGEGSEPYKAFFGEVESKPAPVVDTFRVAHPKKGVNEGTSSGFKAGANNTSRIDWIAVSRDWDVRQAGIDHTAREGRTPSDHFPVYAVLRPAQAKPTMRVMCYNIHHAEGVDRKLDLLRIANVIRAVDPDVVALQEVDVKTRRVKQVDQAAELARLTGMYGAFGKAIDHDGGEYGQAILSRYPLEATKVHLLPNLPEREQRIAFEARITVAGRAMTFVTTHLDHQLNDLREQQATRLNELLGGLNRPVILAGDLNATPESKPLEILRTKWTLATADPGLLTIPVEKPAKQIDFILYRPQDRFRTLSARVLDEAVASDHRAVLAVLEPVGGVLAPYTKPTLIAHRGASGDAPEHTLEAYRLALKQGADYVEPDLQITKDGVLVCLHDTSLERTTNVEEVFPDRVREVKGRKTWPVAEFTLAEIKKLDAGSWKDAKFAGATVPTFQEMIDAVKGQAGVIPETKAPEVYGKLGLNMEKLLMETLKKNGLDQPGAEPRTPVVIQSFSAASLESLGEEHGCKLPRVFLFDGKGATKEFTTAEGLKKVLSFADGIAPHKSLVLERPALVQEAHALGMSVTVWTCRAGQNGMFADVRQEMTHLLRECKVDAIFTDNPDQFPRE